MSSNNDKKTAPNNKAKRDGAKRTPDGRRIIYISGKEVWDHVLQVLLALEESNEKAPTIFIHGNELAQILFPKEGPTISAYDHKSLPLRISEAALFGWWCPATPHRPAHAVGFPFPRHLLDSVLTAHNYWPFPHLIGISEVPVLRRDGSVWDLPGFDEKSGIYYEPAPGFHITVPENPTAQEVDEAKALLDEALVNFPFAKDGASLANMVGFMLTPIVRPAIEGPVPMVVLNAPTQGTGKSKLANLVSIIATGRDAATVSPAENDAEWRKLITSMLREGGQIVVIDNVEGSLRSGRLCMVITQPIWKDRILGVNKVVKLPSRAVWAVTGNNLQVRGDLVRRVYEIRLDAKMERPWQRPASEFLHPDLEGWAKANRHKLARALLILARAWFAAGCPKPKAVSSVLGGFEEWQRIVGGILAHNGIDGFLTNADAIMEGDEEIMEWEPFLRLWYAAKTGPVTCHQLLNLRDTDPVGQFGKSWPTETIPTNRKSDSLTRALGRAFRKRQGQRFGDHRLVRDGMDRNGIVIWRVESLGEAA